MIVQRHRPAARRRERGAAPGRRSPPGREGQPGSAPTSSAGSPAARSRPSNPTRASWTPTRTSWSAPKSKRRRTKCSLTLHDNGDGTTTGHFTVPALAAAILAKVIDAMTAPRRMREPGSGTARTVRSTGGTAAGSRSPSSSSTCRPTTCTPRAPPPWSSPSTTPSWPAPSRQPTSTPTRPSPPEKPAGSPATPDPPRRPRHQVRRPRPRPRDPGCSPSRSESAKGLEHTTCAATGCERPYAWCELHHRQPWAKGGKTDLTERDPALPSTPSVDPRHRLQPPVHARRQRPVQSAHVSSVADLGIAVSAMGVSPLVG